MNYTWEAILEHVARKIGEAAEAEVKAADLVTPPDLDLGDIAFGCFKVAKMKGRNPAEMAKELEEKLKKGDHTIETVKAAGPYLNIVLHGGDLVSRVIQEVEHYKAKYGSTEDGKGRQVMVEYAQPNTHKEMHIGHLRNLVLGSSLAKLLQADGWKVITASYHGDVGAHVSKCLWLLVRENSAAVAQPKPAKPKKGETAPEPLSTDEWTDQVLKDLDDKMADKIIESIPKEKRSGEYLGKVYAEASKLLEENPLWKEQVSEVQRKLESKAAGWLKLWQETRRWSIAEMAETFRELGVTLDRQYFESEVVDKGQKIVDELLKSGIAKPSQGAMVVDLEAEKLGVFLIRKSDGTSLYATKDLALALLKFAEYPKLERSLHVVDYRQSLYFKQLFRTLQLMGVKQPLEYVGYEFLTLKSGAMSSREGNVVTYESFRDEVLAYARKETITRHEDWPQGRVEHTAWCLAMGGIKYGMLKQDSEKIITFELEKALAFEGDTGPYIQYAVTRLNSILKKANWDPTKGFEAGDRLELNEKAEKKLALKLAVFPEVCARAGKELKPSVIAQWCFSAAQASNEFYRDVPVLEAPFGKKQARLQLVAAAASVMIIGLNLLGIPVPDEM
ncbi:MAG: arginine--tRNA ligase [Patescibacteria group bacterium]